MRIIFDYQAFEMQTMGGVSRMFAELYKQLGNQGVGCLLGVKESDNVYLREGGFVQGLMPARYRYNKWFGHEQLFPGEDRLKRLIFNTAGYSMTPNPDYCIKLLKKQSFDVFHPTFFKTYFLEYLGKKPFVLTIHDMIPELYPQYFARDDMQIIGKQILAPKASAIIAVSEKTKEDVIRILNVPEEKVHVIYHGCSFNKPAELHRQYDFPYLLYVGDRNIYKDFTQFVKSAASTLCKHEGLKLVCTGKPFTESELPLFESLGIRDKVVHHWVENDDEFFSLYHFAECFVYPSEYEGFGIPILEAYTADCPVLLNNASCFPEIAGDAAAYFTMDSLTEVLDAFLTDRDAAAVELVRKGFVRLQDFSWKRSAEQLATVYRSCVNR